VELEGLSARGALSGWRSGGEIAFGVTAKVCEPLALQEPLPFTGHKKNVDMIDSFVGKKNERNFLLKVELI
jgi:hypothetical protein